jgi:transposase
MIEPDEVRAILELSRRGWGAKRIAKELGFARNTVRLYLRRGERTGRPVRPKRRRLTEEQRERAVKLLEGVAEGNAVVVLRELRKDGVEASLRTVERAVQGARQARRAADLATVRFETPPGEQMQIDFGEKKVRIAGAVLKVYFFVAVLSYSRRLFVRAFLAQRQDDWREGVAAAFRHFGGVVHHLLIDNPKAMVLQVATDTTVAQLHPEFAAFCKDQGVTARACRAYRARTKGKTESGVKYVKRNAVAGLAFTSFEALESHLLSWMVDADERVHGTTNEKPRERFERDERHRMRPLPSNALPVRQRRLRRRVANDCLVDVDTVRYSVPHRLVKETVEVLIAMDEVVVFHGGHEVARHARCRAPHSMVRNSSHYEGLVKPTATKGTADTADKTDTADAADSSLSTMGRELSYYAAIVEAAGGAA